MNTIRLKQIYVDVNMSRYRGVDSLRRFLEEKGRSWGEGDVFMFRNRDRNIMIAFAPAGDSFAYKRLSKKETFDFSARSRDEIMKLFGKALGLKWNAGENAFEDITKADKGRKENKNASVQRAA